MASSKKSWSRKELLERWREIDEIDETAWSDPSKIQQLKEEWFLDAFNFLICLPKETHIWCGSWELMGPLLETFYNYFKENDDNAPLKILWRRISQEMRQCTQCACQHHQGQETYNSEYELSTVGPLLNVLRSLDEERVIQHLKEINLRIEKGQYDPELHNVEVVSVMFEVLMFPLLLDDQCLANEFQIFIEAIDSCHELTLSGHQQYPGVYALLFLKSRRTRAIGLRLARCIGKLRGATELEPLQPLLKKCIDNLETETLPSTSETSKPRVQLERINIWLGIKSLLGFLEPPAFEEGILERYPNFLSIVLNHVSDDSPEFAHAVNCLRLLFEMLGCKLWLKTAFSPSVMRNTLLSMCFHTRHEKSHKDIFDLFEPFLQSLEALQDGEHETQRRHFLYFLLHQVKMSSNFSVLMRKKACQIAVLIIHRGYKMNPPCPPFECAHMWGPSLICSVKDSTLHSSLRQPAFDLIHTIIVSDAAALSTSLLSGQTDQCTDNNITDFNDEADENPFYNCFEEKDISCWSEYSVIQNKLTSRDCKGWMCVPVLWFELLVETKPSVLQATFHKAVLWAISRFAMVELDTDSEVKVSVQDLLPPSAGRMPFVWEVPTGSDDGGDGKESKNSVKALTMCIPLIKMFKRFTGQFIIHMEHEELWKQWKWEPRMAETVILLLLEPNYAVRHVNRLILEHVSNVQGLACGLQFLSSSIASLSAIYLGLRHAMKLVQLDLVLSKFHDLHHCFFLLNKLLQEAVSSSQKTSTDLQSFSSQGGFLRQPVFDDSPVAHSNVVDPKFLERFLCLLCEVLWPPLRKCLVEGKKFLGEQSSQMTCVRILEIFPVLFERLGSSKSSGNEVNVFNLKWLHDLMDWGESSLVVIGRYWRQSLVKLLDLLNRFCDHNSRSIVEAIEALISDDGVAIEELKEQVSRLSAKLSSQVARSDVISSLRKHPISEDFPARRKFSTSGTKPSLSEDVEVHVLESPELARNLDMNKVIHLSDDEVEDNSSLTDHCQLNENNLLPAADKSILHGDRENSATSSGNVKNFKEACQITSLAEKVGVSSQKLKSDASKSYPAPTSLSQLKGPNNSRKGINNICHSRDVVRSQVDVQSLNKNSRAETVGSKALRTSTPETVGSKAISLRTSTANSDRETRDTIIKEIIWDTDDDPWERAVRSARRPLSLIAKPVSSIPKRQVIQLNMPGQSKSGHFRRDAEFKRLRPPRLDDWYRPILEMDYFSIVGLSSANEDEKATTSVLREVPVSFKSSEHYVDIFRPLVLEELKAQLRSSFVEASSSEEMCSASISVLSVERIDDFHLIRCLPVDSDSAAGRTFSENDLVLLTKHPLENSSHDIHVVGKVERREKDNNRRSVVLVIRFYLQNSFTRLNKVKRFLTERSKWYLSRIMSITPQLREFQALSSLRDIPMLPVILNPTVHSPGSNGLRKVDLAKLKQPLQHVLKSSFNESQLWAISTAIGNHGSSRDFELSLIQGPPGTGKTRTILAIVSGLLACRSQQKNDTLKQLNCSLGPSKSLLTNSRSLFSEAASITRSWHDLALASQLNKEADKISKSADYSTRARVLICAQSNAAVDELVSRISKEGLYGSDGATYQPYLVRVGNAKTVHPSSLGFFIDTLVDQRLAQEKMNGTDKENDKSADTSTTLRTNLEKLMDTIKSYEAQRANMMDEKLDPKLSSKDGAPIENSVKETSGAAVNAKLKNLKEQKRELLISLNAAQAREKKTSEESKALRNKLRKTILREAEIVVSTLSGCGGDLYGVCSESLSTYKFGSTSEHTLFDAVVIDEAAQALEPATLIPLQLLKTNGTKCIMVGDPKQLPATVISHVASKFLYECSMFERLQRAGHAVTMLTHQYRMHPEICRFPSLHFYDNKLLNGEGMSSKVAAFHENEHLGPYVFFDVIDGQECRRSSSGAQSLYNECEADAAVEVLRFFKKRYPSEFGGKRIGIISPYRSQVSVLRSRFSDTFGPGAIADMEFNTVDGFQGREVDILIFSTVRSSDLSSVKPGNNSSIIGFVADVRRMNVALTRAKISLWILGNANTLWTNQSWAALLENANERNLIVSMAKPYKSMFEKHSSASGMNQNICQSEGYSKENDQNKPCPGSGVNQKISQSAGCSKETKSRPKNVGKPEPSGQEQSVEGAPKSSKNGMKQNKSKKVDNNQEEVPEGCKRPNGAGAPNDLITKRKQQREAVDALLSSAFLPSKKPETTSNSRAVKRPASPTKRAIRPAKQRKDQ